MKTSLSIAIAISLVLPLSAAFEDWTNKEGKTAQLELVEVIGEADAKEGVFKMRNGRMVNIKQADLAEADAKRLADWKPAAVPASGAASVFDEALDGNLVILDGKRLKKHELASKPTKYYLFYYTASWCPPCQAFTPSLVKFYQANKPNNDEFEIILVTSDSEEKDMEKYAISKDMTWPHLKLSKADKFQKKFNHPGGGIPNLVLTDLEGKLIKTSYEGKNYLGPTVVMDHLAGLLKK
jgi:thiol-disulfide isomerase/thioredoxin